MFQKEIRAMIDSGIHELFNPGIGDHILISLEYLRSLDEKSQDNQGEIPKDEMNHISNYLEQLMFGTMADNISLSQAEEEGLKIDTHTHVKLTTKKHFNEESFQAMIKIAKKRGLDGFISTEHFWCEDFFTYPEKIHPVLDFKTEFGGEIRVKNSLENTKGGDLVVLTGMKNLKELDNYFFEKKNQRFGGASGLKPDFAELMDYLIRMRGQEPLAVIGSHVMRKDHSLCHSYAPFPEAAGVALKNLNALEICAQDIDAFHLYLEKSRSIERPLLCSSDAHVPLEVGLLYSVFEEPGSYQDIIAQINEGVVRFPSKISRKITDREHQILSQEDLKVIAFCESYKKVQKKIYQRLSATED